MAFSAIFYRYHRTGEFGTDLDDKPHSPGTSLSERLGRWLLAVFVFVVLLFAALNAVSYLRSSSRLGRSGWNRVANEIASDQRDYQKAQVEGNFAEMDAAMRSAFKHCSDAKGLATVPFDDQAAQNLVNFCGTIGVVIQP